MIAEQSTYLKPSIVNREVKSLPVMETFYTLQGEGFHQGKAACFIRLAGCDVGCFWCDVKESWDASLHPQKTIDEIVEMVSSEWSMVNRESQPGNQQPAISNQQPIIVITGGEPLLYNLNALTQLLQSKDFKTHLETSGSSPLSGYWDWICLSPKKFKKPLSEIFKAANELKIVVYNKSDFKWAEKNAALVSSDCKLFLQPEWSKAAEITPFIVDYIKANPQWQLSLQIHKYINVP